MTQKTEGRDNGPHVRDGISYTMKGIYVICGRCIVDYQCFSDTWIDNFFKLTRAAAHYYVERFNNTMTCFL